jgi:hypothetical protein
MGCVMLSSSTPGFIAALCFVASSIAAASIPWRGRTIDEWLPVILRYLVAHRRPVSHVLNLVPGDRHGAPANVGLLEEPTGALSVVLLVESTGIALLEADAKDYRVDGFITALASLAREGSVIDRASWTVATRRSSGEQLLRDLRRRAVGGPGQALEAYHALLGSVVAHGLNRQVLVTLRARLRARRGVIDCDALIEEASSVAQALRESGHQQVSFADLETLRSLFEERIGTTIEPSSDVLGVRIAPVEHFAHLEGASRVATSWWIAEWPRHEVTAELLAPLLFGDPQRLVSVVIEPVAPSVALRKAQSAKTTGAADDELRRRGGFLMDRRRERESSHLLTREAELVDGHGSLRMAGYVSVVASDPGSLKHQIVETELAAAQARLRLLRLQGEHGRGYLATLPLAGGLP